MSTISRTVLCAFLGVICATAASAQSAYSIGHGPLEVFNMAAFSAMPVIGKLWLLGLVATMLSGVFFVRDHLIARWILGGFLASVFTGHLVFGLLGLPMLTGAIAIWHILCWSPGLFLLLIRRPFLRTYEPMRYRVWTAVVAVVIVVCLLFDIRDAVIYAAHILTLP